MSTQMENKTDFKPIRIRKVLNFLFTLITALAMMLPAAIIPAAVPAEAAPPNPAPVQLFYVTLPEADALTVLDAINTAANSRCTPTSPSPSR